MSAPPSSPSSHPPSPAPPPRDEPPAARSWRLPGGPAAVLLSLLFVTWCFVVGTLLMYAPWMPVWARWTASFADPRIQAWVGHPTLRGAVSGFGLFHLVWGTHDLDLLIARFLFRRRPGTEGGNDRSPDPGPPPDRPSDRSGDAA